MTKKIKELEGNMIIFVSILIISTKKREEKNIFLYHWDSAVERRPRHPTLGEEFRVFREEVALKFTYVAFLFPRFEVTIDWVLGWMGREIDYRSM